MLINLSKFTESTRFSKCKNSKMGLVNRDNITKGASLKCILTDPRRKKLKLFIRNGEEKSILHRYV